MLGDLLSGGLKFVSGLMDREAAQENNKQAIAQKNADRAMQEWAMTHGIRTRVKDAEAAGVHPLFALGASTSSYTPSSIGLESTSMGPALRDMGGDISRALAAGGGAEQRTFQAASNKLQLESLSLDNDIKRAKLASDAVKLSATAAGPGSPVVPEADKFEDRPKLSAGGDPYPTNSGTTNAEDFEKRYGDFGDSLYGPMIWLRDEMDRAGGSELNTFLTRLLVKMGVLNPTTHGDVEDYLKKRRQ